MFAIREPFRKIICNPACSNVHCRTDVLGLLLDIPGVLCTVIVKYELVRAREHLISTVWRASEALMVQHTIFSVLVAKGHQEGT